MLAQRATQQALRRFGTRSVISGSGSEEPRRASLPHIPDPDPHLTPADSYKILVEQRRLRPISPHLSIYRPQITWYASMFNRITGVVLSGTFYLFGIGYLAAPVLGLNLAIRAAGGSVRSAGRSCRRHLVWDTGRQFTNKAVIKTGWTVVGLTAASSLYLSLFV
ncbi:hypothetical protein VE04_01931 [Pseudogymnoascus sp. 24MN13]|nr:hypothetical protein VE04_01931 [Pseudogymnoascus sp. 24MN13]